MRRKELAPCGTPAKYEWHRRRGQDSEACGCKAAHADARRRDVHARKRHQAERDAALRRALERLALRHQPEFAKLYSQELRAAVASA